MRVLFITLLFFNLCVLSACDRTDAIGKVNGKAVSREEYEAFLKIKNIPLNDTGRYQRMKEQYINRAALAAAIEESGALDRQLTEAEVNEFKKQLLISRYFERYLNDSVTDESIQNFYSGNADNFQSEQVHVAHILFRVNPKMDESERQAVLTTAHEAYSKIQSGQDFSDVAKAMSEDKVSAERGGDLGWIVKGAVAPEFSTKSFAMTKGEVSEPFLTSFGFHILKILDEPKIVKKPMEAVQGDIRYQLRNNAKQAETERLLGTIAYEINNDKKPD